MKAPGGPGPGLCCPNGQGPCLCSQCADGLDGNGTCICQDGFRGSQCQFCTDPNKYGPQCDKSKCRFQSCLLLLSPGPCSTATSQQYSPGIGCLLARGHLPLHHRDFLSAWVPNGSRCQIAGPHSECLRQEPWLALEDLHFYQVSCFAHTAGHFEN